MISLIFVSYFCITVDLIFWFRLNYNGEERDC